MSDADLKAAFDACDLDGKGTISAKELAAVLRVLKEDESLAPAMIQALDKNDDGEVSFDEFKSGLSQAKQQK